MGEFVYIIQATLEPEKCKIGITDDLERRLSNYNSLTGVSQDNRYHYRFTCEVTDMRTVENDIKKQFSHLRGTKNREVYFYNSTLFSDYSSFIKAHPAFIKELVLETEVNKFQIKLLKKVTPSFEERGVTRAMLLAKVQKNTNDECFTRYEDIEKELSCYPNDLWDDKVVFCNCDDAVDIDERRTSAFALYFLHNFKNLNLKKLICTHYGGGVDLFNQGVKGYIFTKEGFEDTGVKAFPKNYTGSFDDPISIKILNEEADIICTNPPFSRANDFWHLLLKSGKKFIILGSFVGVMTNWAIALFKNGQVWAGYNRVDKFLTTKREVVAIPAFWFTNVALKERPRSKLLKCVPLVDIPEKYKFFDDIGTLVVDHGYIPINYTHPFAISVNPLLNGILELGYQIVDDKKYYHLLQSNTHLKSGKKFARVLIQKAGLA